MKSARWKEIERLCQSALVMEPHSRKRYLEEACAGDESLRNEVEALLAQQTKAEGFLKDPALEAAAKMLAKDQETALARNLTSRTVSHYRIIEKIGQGGMGEVFLAEDTSLNRKVALKFLPPELQQDAVAHKRLMREARSAGALDHPYICSIHEVGEFEGKDFIVMEYVDGQTLMETLRRGRMPLKQELQIAAEIAEALQTAHGKGIIHRDLKPSNIMLTRTGHAKVMDFGLAKQLIPPGGIASREESVTALTRSGMTLGTLAYMSPEQLRGETVDARSDLFSFGVVLYEMLAGVHPFKKQTGMDTASAILNSAPQPLGDLRPDVPVLLQHIVKKMLAKDPEHRYSSVHDAEIDLKELLEGSGHSAGRKRQRLRLLFLFVAAVVVVVSAGIWTFSHFFTHVSVFPQPRIVTVTTYPGRAMRPSFSPDGHWIAYGWNGEKQDNWDIYVREVEGTGFNRLTTDPAFDRSPAWSPDGRQIAFFRDSGHRSIIYLVSPLGGRERKLAEGNYRCCCLNWSPDGKNLVYSGTESPNDPAGIRSLSVDTLERNQLTSPLVGSPGDVQPAYSPDGRYIAFVRRPADESYQLFVKHLPRGEPRLLTDYMEPSWPCWTADSQEIVLTTDPEAGQNALWRISVDGGEPRRVPARGDKVGFPTINRNRLAYVNFSHNVDIWRLELTGKEAIKPPSKPLISWSSNEYVPRISPDGSRIVFASNRSGSLEIWACNADGTQPMKLTDMKVSSTGSPNWSPDGKWIAFDSIKSGNNDLYAVSAEGGPARRLTTDVRQEVVPRWSWNGRWIYFGSNRSGSWQIWKMPSAGGKAIKITKEGGLVARESADGQSVYFYGYYEFQRKGVWRVPASGGPETLVLDKEIDPHSWDLTDRGIYLINSNSKPLATVCLYDFATHRLKSLAPVHNDPGFTTAYGMSVSPDGKWLLYCGGIENSDIMMIDNFR